MTRDTLKTLAGLTVIALIVVATFLYGNAQRQAQLKRDQQAKQQQEEKAKQQAVATPTPTPTIQPSTGSTGGTAPVKSPSASTIQGGESGGAVAGAQAKPGSQQVAGAPLPEAGPPLAGMIGLASIADMGIWMIQSKRRIIAAARNRR